MLFRYAAMMLVLALFSCSSNPLNPSNWFPSGGGEAAQTTTQTDAVTATASVWMDMLLRFGWFGIILLFVVPGVRVPFVALWTAIFRVMTIPFEFIRFKFDSWKNEKALQNKQE